MYICTCMCMSNLWFVPCSHAIYANRLYLSLFKERHPTYLAITSSSSPQIIGAVRIHPSAEIDPSAVVGDQTSPSALLRYNINIPPSRSSLSPLPPPFHTSHPSHSLPLTPPSSLDLTPLPCPPFPPSLPAGSQCVCGCWSGDWSRCTC